jgi:hypothetical protein
VARIVFVDRAKSLQVLSECLCNVVELLCFVDAVYPKPFVFVSCKEANVSWGHAIMMKEDGLFLHDCARDYGRVVSQLFLSIWCCLGTVFDN